MFFSTLTFTENNTAAAEPSGEQRAGASIADRELAQRVHLFLAGRQVGELRRIGVAARHGHVRLTGSVSSFYHRQLAVVFVRKVAGVLTVEDQITVGPTGRKVRPQVQAGTAFSELTGRYQPGALEVAGHAS